ncbi:MAG TPA: DUF5666 domain-containing protein [Thermoanaerobaculia bacterium]|nr:DUF5666 domain-containing protein [Thermoanaerobaculia bacterium]
MTRNLRLFAVFAILAVPALSTFAQTSPSYGTNMLTGTIIDVDEGHDRLQMENDSDPGSRITVETDSVSTQYRGFGSAIGGKAEIFTGSKGFSNLRLGDRVSVRGTSRASGVVLAETVTLLGRQVAASPTGVGQTRSQTSVATPTEVRAGAAANAVANIEGTIRQINANDYRIVIQTGQRRMMTIRTARNTPVIYRNQNYQVSNLEIGDTIRVEIDPRDAQLDEVAARRIEVTRSVQESDTNRTGGVVTVIEGTVTRTETGLDYAYVDDGRGEVRVDMSGGEDPNGARVHARDLRSGDRVEITGSFNRVGDIFAASTVRITSGSRVDVRAPISSYSIVTITATVTETLEDSPTLGMRDRDTNRAFRLWCTEDLLVKTKSGTTTINASALRVNDVVLLKAFRDADGNLIAQTMKLRNR